MVNERRMPKGAMKKPKIKKHRLLTGVFYVFKNRCQESFLAHGWNQVAYVLCPVC